MNDNANQHPTIILIGHCGPDIFMLRNAVERIAPDATVDTINDQKKLNEIASPAVLLVNRVLDGRFATDSGIDLIQSLIGRNGDTTIAMLISNFQDAQQHAQQVGAHPGFGKTQLYDDSTAYKLRNAIDALSA